MSEEEKTENVFQKQEEPKQLDAVKQQTRNGNPNRSN